MSDPAHRPLDSRDEDIDRLVARTRGIQPWRRVFHAVTGLLLAFTPPALGLDSRTTAGLLGAAFVVLLLADLARLGIPAINRLFFRTFSGLASPREVGRVASSTWYALGAFLVWAFFPVVVAQGALVVLGLADPAASVFGRLVGRTPLGKGTWEGSAVFVMVAAGVLWPMVGPLPALVAALVTGAAEVLPVGIDDNLLVPVVCGVALTGLVGGMPWG